MEKFKLTTQWLTLKQTFSQIIIHHSTYMNNKINDVKFSIKRNQCRWILYYVMALYTDHKR